MAAKTIAIPDWDFEDLVTRYQRLAVHAVQQSGLTQWLNDWSQIHWTVRDHSSRLYIATTMNTASVGALNAYLNFLENERPVFEALEVKVKANFLQTTQVPDGLKLPAKKLRQQVSLFRQKNIPRHTEESKLVAEFDRVLGAQTILIDGQEQPLASVAGQLQAVARPERERLWHLIHQRIFSDRKVINDLWQRGFRLRHEIALEADFKDYISYQWQRLQRFDYTQKDAETFRRAIKEVVVPAASRRYEVSRENLGVSVLRPWDILHQSPLSPPNKPRARPFHSIDEFISRGHKILGQVDPVLGAHFGHIEESGYLDLDNRKSKAGGGFCLDLPSTQSSFIFMNAVGTSDDVRVLMHEAGHGFHNFEMSALPFHIQRDVGLEFCELASMGMEFLSSHFWGKDSGGYYDQQDLVRAIIEQLEQPIFFWPYMAAVDEFQHWAYSTPSGLDPAACDAKWQELTAVYMPAISWDGLEKYCQTGWHRKRHIHQYPFYYIEYGIALLGALQVYQNSCTNYRAAVSAYRNALRAGGTKSLPELFNLAGAELSFDINLIGRLTSLCENTIASLEHELH